MTICALLMLSIDSVLEAKIKALAHNVIIDAQVPWREKREGELYFSIQPPLNVLLDRDQLRTQHLNRCKKQADDAHNYVIETFNALKRLNPQMFNRCFDSSKESVQDEIDAIKQLLQL